MAFHEFYRLVGELTIPEEKKEEVNTHVLTLLDRSGVRKTKKVKIGDFTTKVAERVKMHKNGKVLFDYSIYENLEREVSSYDTETCTLKVNDPGFHEMGIAMVMIMVLLESYSVTPCYVARENKLIQINGYALMIEDLIGVRLRFPHRADIWTMYTFCRESEEVEKITHLDLAIKVPEDFEGINYSQWFDTSMVEKYSSIAESVKEVAFDRSQIETATYEERCRFLYSTLLSLEREKKDICAFLEKLMLMSFDERMRLAQEQTNYGIAAELTKYLSSQILVMCYSLVKGSEFWSEWKRMSAKGYYVDFIADIDKIDEKKHRPFHFYEAIHRDFEDEALGEYGERTLSLSGEMLYEIEKWKETANEEITENLNSEEELKSIMEESDCVWASRKMDAALFKELKENPNSESTKKILLLLRSVLDEGLQFFPELTKNQAKNWVLKNSRSSFDKKKFNGLLGLLANKDKRMDLLGF